MSKCSAIKRSGERCKGVAIDGSGLCYAHHPDHADARQRAARAGGKKGGRGRPLVEVAEMKAKLSDLYSSVFSGTLEPKIGSVLAQIANARIRLVETELKVREQQELVERIEELEGVLDQRNSQCG